MRGLHGCTKSTQPRVQISYAPCAAPNRAAPALARAVIKRATGLNDLYCHIGAFIMTLDRPPPPRLLNAFYAH